MSMKIGQLRHRMQLEEPGSTADGAGGSAVTWQPVAAVWASLRLVSASDQPVGESPQQQITHEIFIRHRGAVTSAMRFALGTRVFQIRTVVDPFETGAWLRCLVEETTP